MKHIKIAILDLYEGHPNEGMRCIREIIQDWGYNNGIYTHYKEYDVRQKNEVPDLSYDIYISTGGPGSPLDSVNTNWEKNYFNWIALTKIKDSSF